MCTHYTEADPGSVKMGGRESKFLDVAPENNKNRPKKQKSAEKRGGGAAADSAPPPPPWIRHCYTSGYTILKWFGIRTIKSNVIHRIPI